MERNEQASRRININIESNDDSSSSSSQQPKEHIDITHKIRIELLSPPSEMKRGGTIRLKCSVDEPNAGVVWTKRGSKFSSRASGSATESLHTALLTIKNFQHDDLGVYICKAKSLDASKSVALKGELLYYLMSSQFGFAPNEQLLLGPDTHIESSCGGWNESCRIGEPLTIKCEITNFDTGFPELKVNEIQWKRVGVHEDLDVIKDSRPLGRKIDTSLKLTALDDSKLGNYACYVHASTGTIRHEIEVKKLDEDPSKVRVNVPKQTKKIQLVIEKSKPHFQAFQGKNEMNLGGSYQFDCVSGMTLHKLIFISVV